MCSDPPRTCTETLAGTEIFIAEESQKYGKNYTFYANYGNFVILMAKDERH